MSRSPHLSARRTLAVTLVIAACAAMAGSATAQEGAPTVVLGAVTAGPGTLSITPSGRDPVEAGVNEVCKVDGQNVTTGTCEYMYAPGTRVTVTARPDSGARFAGWSDYTCRRRSRTCSLTMSETRYITARFSPVTLTVTFPQGSLVSPFGDITVSPASPGLCRLTPATPPCTYSYKQGTVVSLRRQLAAPGRFWIGACQGNVEGKLDATVCRTRLRGDEQVGAGDANVAAIPPPRGSGIAVVVSSKKRGKVTGRVVNGGETLKCGSRCTVTGVTRYDSIRLTATALKGSRFVRWSDGRKLRKRIVQFSSVNRIKATFARSRRR